jgi:hypothetical protein
MTRHIIHASLPSVLLLVILNTPSYAQGALADGRRCNGTYGGTFKGQVAVSAGQTCTITNGRIIGSVIVNGGTFSLTDATVEKNVRVDRGRLVLNRSVVEGNVTITAGSFSISRDTTIDGNVDVAIIQPGGLNRICNTAIGGHLRIHDSNVNVWVGAPTGCQGNTVGGHLHLERNGASITLFGNTVASDLHVSDSEGSTLIVGNNVRGNTHLNDNIGSLQVSTNAIGKMFVCSNNREISGGGNEADRNLACPNDAGVPGVAAAQKDAVEFRTPAGRTLAVVNLQNHETVTPDPAGDVVDVVRERAFITAAGSHVAVFTTAFRLGPVDDGEPRIDSAFTYYTHSGRLWSVTADPGRIFRFPISQSSRAFTPDGSRLLLITTVDGGAEPSVSLYSSGGDVLDGSLAADLLELFDAQLSPNGRYILIIGTIMRNDTSIVIIRSRDIAAKRDIEMSFDVLAHGMPRVEINQDGRFVVSSPSGIVMVP